MYIYIYIYVLEILFSTIIDNCFIRYYIVF